jgi:Cu/Ag efflux pump CusA
MAHHRLDLVILGGLATSTRLNLFVLALATSWPF